MAFARGPYVLMILAAGLAAAFWLGDIALPVSLTDASTTAYAIAVAATSAVAMLAIAIGALVVSDWQADVQSHQDWVQLGLTPTHVSRPLELARESDVDPRYLAPASDEALRRVLQAYRAAAQKTYSASDLERSAGLPPAQPVPDRARDAGAVSKADAPKRAPSDVAGTRLAAAQTVVPSWKSKRRKKVIAGQVRLVANGDTWPLWTTRISPPAKAAGEVIVLSASQDEQTLPRPEVSVGAPGYESTAQPACRGPPQVIARRRDTAGPTAEQPLDRGTVPSPDDIIVGDDLGPQIPISDAELEVIETYLGHVLDDLLASAIPKPNSDRS